MQIDVDENKLKALARFLDKMDQIPWEHIKAGLEDNRLPIPYYIERIIKAIDAFDAFEAILDEDPEDLFTKVENFFFKDLNIHDLS